jgi:hypothetical protein
MAKVYRSYQPEQDFLLPPSPREWPKREISEGGMTWEEQQEVRRWAAQLYFIASQEMLHLALVLESHDGHRWDAIPRDWNRS